MNERRDKMSNREAAKLTAEQIAAIEKTLNHGERVEIIPTKNGIVMYKESRRKISIEPAS